MNKKLKDELLVGNRSQAESQTINLLRFQFKKLTILPNDKTAIGKELDLYLPEFKVAIEIDGITHWKPIFGEETLQRTIKADQRKDLLCEQAGIKLIRIKLPEKSGDTYIYLKEDIKDRVVPEIRTWLNNKT